MLLHFVTVGEADAPAALLVHGLFADHGNWWRVVETLTRRGYQVVMPDLAGHGRSSRRDQYTPQSWADDLVDTFGNADFEMAIGHSLGGLALALAATRLSVRRIIYLDPIWKMSSEQHASLGSVWRDQASWTPERWAVAYPLWADGDVESRIRSIALMDPGCVDGAAPGGGHDFMPRAATPGIASTVLVADQSQFVSTADAEQLIAAGFDVRVTPTLGHAGFRENFEGFETELEAVLGSSTKP